MSNNKTYEQDTLRPSTDLKLKAFYLCVMVCNISHTLDAVREIFGRDFHGSDEEIKQGEIFSFEKP